MKILIYIKKIAINFYDDRLNDNLIEELIGDWKNDLNNNYPAILIYRKE